MGNEKGDFRTSGKIATVICCQNKMSFNPVRLYYVHMITKALLSTALCQNPCMRTVRCFSFVNAIDKVL